MTLVRLTCLSLALGLAACATSGRIHEPTAPTAPTRTYNLCSDPQFDCTPASLQAPAAQPIRVDTNLLAPRSSRSLG